MRRDYVFSDRKVSFLHLLLADRHADSAIRAAHPNWSAPARSLTVPGRPSRAVGRPVAAGRDGLAGCVMQAPGGPQEDPSENFTYGGWQAPFSDPAVGEFVTELNSHASAFLLGRRTFDIFRGYWPDQTDPANPSPRRSTRCPSTSCPVPSARPAPPGAASTPTPPGW
jgi:hypothetical protein